MTATFAFRRTLRGGASLFAITIARLVLICVIVVGSTARAIDYTGQVVSAADGIPIEGATITLDTTPDPGSPGVDYAGTTSPFGMFGFDSVDAGAYQVDVTRDGFLPETFSLTLTQDVLTQTIELTPDAGPERHDVYVSVKGIMTGLPAEGAAVAARLFSSAADTTGSVVANLTIDGEGNGLFRGLGIGFYEVEVTPPAGWLPFATPRVELTQTHHAAILLTPQKRDIEVIVQGHDPRVKEGDPVRTLPQVYVELTGHAEGDPDAVLVAKRSGVTVENGRVFFRGVPTVVPYKLQIKRLGYTTITETVPAVNSAARLTLNRTLAIEPHSLRVELEHPAYEKLAVFEGLEVRLVGLKETNTEGIDCTLDTGEVPNVRRFEDLVPGRYELSVDGEGTSAELTLHPHFEFVDYIELFGEGMEEMAAELTVRGNLVSGQLLAADQKAYSNKGGNQHPSDYLPAGRPRYEPKANTEITFVEYAVDPCLSPDFREITVTTDENGQFTVDLPPARYGLRMAALTDYWGSHVLLKEQGEDPLPLPVGGLPDGRQSFPAAGQGWPFAEEWPFPGSPPSNGTPLPGLPLVLDGRDFDLDVYLRKQLVSVLETISGSAAPTQSHVLGLERLPEDAGYLPIRYSDYGDLNDGGVARLVTAGGATQTGDIYPAFKPRRLEGTTVETEGFLYFEAVPPGTHTLSVEHDRFDFVLVELPFGGETTPARKTWTIPPWPAPGVLPATDPATDPAYIEPFSVIPGGGPITPDNLNFDLISGRYRAGGPITIREHHWIEPDDGSDPFYELVNTTVMEGEDAAFDYMKTGYAGGRTFDAVSIVPFGSFTFWIGNYSGSAGGGAQSFDFYAGGPMDNSLAVDEETGLPSGISLPIYDSLSGGPAETYPLRVTAINDAERDGDPVPNIAIKINNGPTLLSGGVRQVSEQPIAELFEPVEITSPPWTGVPSDETAFLFDENGQIVLGPDFRPVMINLMAHEFRDLNDTEGGIDLVPELIVYIRRGLEVTGSVTSVGEGAPGIPGATVLVRDRFGTTIGVANTDADGNWALPVGVSALQDASPPVYVDVRAPGYAPWRERFSADAIDPTQNKLAVSAALAPLPPVEIDEAIFDRTGLFLSGLYFAHNADALDALKLTWEATFDAGEQTVELIPFDDENGNPGEPEVVTASNPPVAVYLVNTVGITGHRYNATPSAIFNHKPGTEVDQGMLRTWLEDAIKRTVPNVFHTRPVQPEKVALTAYHATGEIHIWKLPPVPFRPIVVVKSANGTLSIRSDFADPTTATSAGDGDPLLDGGSVPSWLATVANAMGFMGALQDAVGGNPTPEQRQEIFDALDEAFPSGALSMLPNFTADITTVAASGNAAASALAYRYGLNLTWREGMSNPSSDWMRFLSDPLGVEFEVGAELGLDNSEERPFFLNGSGSVSAALKPEKFVPKVLRQFSFEPKATGSVNGGFEIQSTAPTAKGGLDLEISANLGATVQTTVPINLAPITSKVPAPVGPVLLGLDRSKVLQLILNLRGGVGMNVERKWDTSQVGQSQIVGEHVQMISYPLGVLHRDPPNVRLGLALGGGIEMHLFSGSVGAGVELALQGPEEPFGFSAIVATLSEDGSWPYVRKLQGELAANVYAWVDVWVLHWEKNWSIPLIDINPEFTTDPSFSWQPMEISLTMNSPATAPLPGIAAGSGTLIQDFYPTGRIATAKADTSGMGSELLLFTGINAQGQMTVEAIKRTSGGTFGSRSVIASAGGVLDVAAQRLGNGEWLAVWSELDAADLGKLSPGSRVQFATSANGTTWSAAQTVAAFPGEVVSQLRLATNGDTTALGMIRTGQGPTSSRFAIDLVTFGSGGSWSAPAPVVDLATIVAWDVVAEPGDARAFVLAHSDGTEGIRSLLWNAGGGATTNLPLIEGVVADLHLAGAPRRPAIAYAVADQGTMVRVLNDQGNGWTEPAASPLMGISREVSLHPLPEGAVHGYLLTSSLSGGIGTLSYRYLSDDGAAATPVVIAEGAPNGLFSGIRAYPRADGAAVLLSVLRSRSGADSVRQMTVSPVAATVDVELINPRHSPLAGFSVDVVGQPETTYRILRSADLLNWLDYGTAQGGEVFRDPDPGDENYYRVK